MNGKGSQPRKTNLKKYRENYERIFKKRDKKDDVKNEDSSQ